MRISQQQLHLVQLLLVIVLCLLSSAVQAVSSNPDESTSTSAGVLLQGECEASQGTSPNDDDDDKTNTSRVEEEEKEERFQLFEDFDISEYVRGGDSWSDLINYKGYKASPSLSFYWDKNAFKRWLLSLEIPIPKIYFLAYADKLSETGDVQEEALAILEAFPSNGSFAAKPTHMAYSLGTQLVDHLPDGTTRFSDNTLALNEKKKFVAEETAKRLASNLHQPGGVSWSLIHTKPGVIIEERWSSPKEGFHDCPPDEFKINTFWGRVWLSTWDSTNKGDNPKQLEGFVYRNGTIREGSSYLRDNPGSHLLPDWIPWEEMVQIAEKLGANKDFFRTDIFVGRPSDDPSAPVQLVVNEFAPRSKVEFYDEEIHEEGARLWREGYVHGRYDAIPNTEVPPEYYRDWERAFPNIGFSADKCQDAHIDCHEWAQRGECKNNPGYMESNCRRSCHFCEG